MRFFIGLLSLHLSVLFLASCRDQGGDKLTYEEQSDEEYQQAIQAAFVDSSSGVPEEEIPKGLDRYFRVLGKMSRSEGSLDPEQFLTLEGMISALKSSGALDGLSGSEMRGFEKGFRSASGKLGTSLKQMAYDDYKIVLVERIDEDQRLVYTKLYDNELGVVTQMRWWMVLTKKGWRTYDFEDVSMGLRTVKLMGTMIKNGIGKKQDPWVDDFTVVLNRLQTMNRENLETMVDLEGPLVALRKNKLPSDISAFASMMLVSIYSMKEEPEKALEELAKAEAGGYSTPLFHYQKGTALSQVGRHGEAVASFEKHISKLGSDSDIQELMSDAQLANGNPEKAVEAALEGLADNPNSSGCLASLLIATSSEDLASEVVQKSLDESGSAEEALEFAMDTELPDDLAKARVLFGILKEKIPTSDLIEYYEKEFSQQESDKPDE